MHIYQTTQLPQNNCSYRIHVCTCTAAGAVQEHPDGPVDPRAAVMASMISNAPETRAKGTFSQQTQAGFDWLVGSILDDWEGIQAQRAVERLQNPFSDLIPADPIPNWRRESMFSRASSIGAGSFGASSWRVLSGRRRSSASVGHSRASKRRKSSGARNTTKDTSREVTREHEPDSQAGSPRRVSEAASLASRTSKAQSVTFQAAGSVSANSSCRSTGSRVHTSPGAFPLHVSCNDFPRGYFVRYC